jgi:toxin-antitoxin system PIN domain toxin
VVLVDANVLLYAANRSARQHAAAHGWLESALGEFETVGFAWSVLLAFVRIATQRAIFPHPLTTARALDYVDEWLATNPEIIIDPGPRHLAVLRDLLDQAGTAGNLVSDAHLAALALANDAAIVSFDRDFARFDGLQVQVPA